MTGRENEIRVSGERRRRIDTRHLAEVLVRITVNRARPETAQAARGVIDRSSDDAEERER